MTDIRYVVLSDLHLGEEESLLTNVDPDTGRTVPLEPSPMLRALGAGLGDLLGMNAPESPRPTLVLLGDVFELALAPVNEATMAFERFLEVLAPGGQALFGRILFVPGNHDHHFWQIAREAQHLMHLETLPPGAVLPPAAASTPLLPDPARPFRAKFPTRMMQRYPAYKDLVVELAYPNVALLGEDGRRGALLTHGHFVEPAYRIMSTLATALFEDPPPATVDELEIDNGAWIDFLWSLMGSCGRVGQKAELLYECLRAEPARKRLVERMARSLARSEAVDLPGLGDWIEEHLARAFLNAVVGWIARRERGDATHSLSDTGEAGLRAYVEGPLHAQVAAALGPGASRPLPEAWSVLFGHTHKPFAATRRFEGLPGETAVFNTGGWVVESDTSSFLHGAAAVVMDGQLDATSIRLYVESDAGPTPVHAQAAPASGEAGSPLHHEVEARLRRSATLWKDVARVADAAVHERQRLLAARRP